MKKLVTLKAAGVTFLAVLVGSSVVAWSRATATGAHEARLANQMRGFAPDEMHRALTGKLPHEKFHDMSFVYSAEH